jgi:phosphopantothenoylcysteine synthetase/decarboxylase
VALLESRGVQWVGPGEGMLSCGYEGLGRLAPIEEILREVGVLPD